MTEKWPRSSGLPARLLMIAFIAGGGGCGSGAATAQPGKGDSGTDGTSTPATDQVPPQGQARLEPWLAAGTYKAWTCESQIHDPRADPATPDIIGSHGRHRICTNDILLSSASVPYPVGSASVKELFDATDGPYGFAVGVKVTAGSGSDTWYWYERIGRLSTLQPVADGVGDPTCGTDCHALAARDNVFIRAPQ